MKFTAAAVSIMDQRYDSGTPSSRPGLAGAYPLGLRWSYNGWWNKKTKAKDQGHPIHWGLCNWYLRWKQNVNSIWCDILQCGQLRYHDENEAAHAAEYNDQDVQLWIYECIQNRRSIRSGASLQLRFSWSSYHRSSMCEGMNWRIGEDKDSPLNFSIEDVWTHRISYNPIVDIP